MNSRAAHIPGAVNLAALDIRPSAIAARPGQTVVFGCRSGVRSLKAIETSRSAGFPYDTHYSGSMLEWAAVGQPVEAG